jgi:hypothetical protein
LQLTPQPVQTALPQGASMPIEGDEMADYEIFELGDVVLQSAITLRGTAPT